MKVMDKNELVKYIGLGLAGCAAGLIGGKAGYEFGKLMTPENFYFIFGYTKEVSDSLKTLESIVINFAPYVTATMGAVASSLLVAGTLYEKLIIKKSDSPNKTTL